MDSAGLLKNRDRCPWHGLADGAWRARLLDQSHGSRLLHRRQNRRAEVRGAGQAVPLRDPFARPLWATPLGIGDRLHLFGKDGLTTVLKPGPSFEILRENTLWDPNLAIDQSVIDRETDSVRKPCTPNRRSWAPQRSTGRC